jgi:hypothetical protein
VARGTSPGGNVKPGKRRAPEGTGADAQHHQPESYTDSETEQLTLWAEAVPSHALHLDEWHMKFIVNTTQRGRSHWWIADQRRRSA